MLATFIGVASVSIQRRSLNEAQNKMLPLPRYAGRGPLAVVGGGPSIRAHVEELRNFPGTIWAVNGAINWCLDHGIDAWFYTVDAAVYPENWIYRLDRVKKAALAIDVDQSVFEALKHADVAQLPRPQWGPTSACAADIMALEAGHTSVVYYGCESSFTEDESHAFDTFTLDQWIEVEVGGKHYPSKPEFVQQAQTISGAIREFPGIFSEKSGGLLRAMVEHGPDYELTFVSPEYRRMSDEERKALGPQGFQFAKSRDAIV